MEISKTKASLLATLSSKKMRVKHGIFLVEGTKCVTDTLGAFPLVNLIATEDWLKCHEMKNNIPEDIILTASDEVMKKISSLSTPPEVIAVFNLPEENDETFTLKDDSLYIMLDGVQDPGNLGTIIRTADWFGIETVICSKDTADIYNPKTIQATMGSLKRVKVIYADLPELLKRSKVGNVYGTLLNGENIFEKKLHSAGVIVMGNEGNGISEAMRCLITDPLFIPPSRVDAHPESLNVAIATAVVIAQFRK